MENAWLVILSALLSGALATLVTIFVNKHDAKMSSKKEVLNILLSYRYEIANENCVNALNRIQVVFYNNNNVINAWNDFNNTTKSKDKQNEVIDKYLKLLENIAASCGYKKLKWDEIKTYYFPDGLANKKIEEALIRNKTLKNMDAQNRNSGSVDSQTALMFVMEMMKQPNGFENLMKLAEVTKKDK